MSQTKSLNILAYFLLIICFLLSFFSMVGISLTMDELAHIPAGFSYLYAKDYRLNPEHPPLVKDLAALPLLFLNLNFPANHPSWQTGVNNQWWFGNQFIFKSGNNPDLIMFWARIPMILLTILFCWFVYFWAKKLFGPKLALIPLIFAVFSPTILAHGRLVTTDIAASFGFLFATYFWIKFLKSPTKKNIFIAGITLGISLLLKFSLALLVPILGIITITYALLKKENKIRWLVKYIIWAIVAGIIGVVLIIWPVYAFHIWNYPIQKQVSDTQSILASHQNDFLKKICIWMAGNPLLRPLAHYMLGILMATQRVTSGNTVYFLGTVSGGGIKSYFPIVYLLKVPLGFHLLFLIALIWILIKSLSQFNPKNCIQRTKKWTKNNFEIFSLIVIIAVYWITSISGDLNIGVRHILPTFAPAYLILAFIIKTVLERSKSNKEKLAFVSILSVMIVWYVGSSLAAFPHYLSYFNELAGGPTNGYKYVVDSNYDWGQDLKRLQQFVEENNIQKIYVDYFGGDDVEYRLGKAWQKFDPKKEKPEGWLAISATFLQGGIGKPIRGFNQPTGYYRWLLNYKPVSRAGNSMFIYYIK